MNDTSNNIKKVLLVYLLCFIGVIIYISYFEVFTAPKIVNNPMNQRLWAKRNEVLRGTIYDRNKKPLTQSERVDVLNQKRKYTGSDMFAHVLGYVDIKYGITGLERKYDKELMTDSTEIFNFLDIGKEEKPKVGSSLVTTLDYNIQKQAYDALGTNKGAVVVINPNTGEIIAMVSKPSFNPNNISSIWNDINSNKDRPLLNRAVSGLYPPGSTFKTITAISALENIEDIDKKIFNDQGKLTFNSKESISNFNGESFGKISFKNAYIHSSNVVFGTIGLQLGNDNLKKTAEKFYFNKEIPADGIVIDNSIFPSYKKNEQGNIAQSAIGQSGVLASPIQLAEIASTIANDGVMMKPYLVSKVINKNGDVIREIKPEILGKIIDTDEANTMKDLMRAVVKEGTGTSANIPGLNICGKTGTAEHNDDGSKIPHSLFISFAPYEKPTIAVAVIVEDGGQGGGIAANIATQIMKATLLK